METFEIDLTFIQYEYYSWLKNLIDSQENLLEELKDATGKNKERIINELNVIDKNVLEWNLFVESIIEKYKEQENLIHQLEKYLIQPER